MRNTFYSPSDFTGSTGDSRMSGPGVGSRGQLLAVQPWCSRVLEVNRSGPSSRYLGFLQTVEKSTFFELTLIRNSDGRSRKRITLVWTFPEVSPRIIRLVFQCLRQRCKIIGSVLCLNFRQRNVKQGLYVWRDGFTVF